MRFFKVVRELIFYRRYLKKIKELSEMEAWKKYKFASGWFGQFGILIRLDRANVVNNFNQIESFTAKFHIIEYLKPFFDFLTANGITPDSIIPKIKFREDLDYRTDINHNYVFFEAVFWFAFKHLTFTYILTRTLMIIGLIIIAFQFTNILDIIQGIF